MEPYKVKDLSLSKKGLARIEWARERMPVLASLREEFAETKPFEGMTLAACLHVTKETAVLMETLKTGGAKVALCGSNPLSTQDDVAAALVEMGIHVYAWHGINNEDYYWCVDRCLDHKPTYTMDDGADLVTRLHTEKTDLLEGVQGGTEETTTGVTRFRAMAEDGALKYPIVAVNDSQTKHFFDNRYGTGQSTVDALLRGLSILIAGKKAIVAGYGWCGRGIANRLKGMGANVTVTEVDPVRALEAAMDGFRVAPLAEAIQEADLLITATGNKHVVRYEHLEKAKDNIFVANSGHFDNEIDAATLRENAREHVEVREGIDRYTLKLGNRVNLLGQGRLVNLAMAEGHPPDVMDLSFANQAKAVLHLMEHDLDVGVYTLPREVDQELATRKLESMDITFDVLTDEQRAYLTGWKEGT